VGHAGSAAALGAFTVDIYYNTKARSVPKARIAEADINGSYLVAVIKI